MSSTIRILNEKTINQIAAGEVIENPASVIKELVDNAIDAQSTEICIEILSGGYQLIRISDNGQGMNDHDCLLSIERHATSKIKKLDDLFSSTTLGFRGEALPSIASIAKITIKTRPQNQEKGSCLIIKGSKLLHHSQIHVDIGTSIEVSDLFYNVPARKQFQKSIRQSIQEIKKHLTTQILAHPHVKWTFINNQAIEFKYTRDSSASNFTEHLIQKATLLIGKNIIQECIPIQQDTPLFKIEGLLSKPSLHRNNKTLQLWCINYRPIISPWLSSCLMNAYGTSLPPRRFPGCFLNISILPQYLDVNVHPQKYEIRFRNKDRIEELLTHTLRKSLFHTANTIQRPLLSNKPTFLKKDCQSLWQKKQFFSTLLTNDVLPNTTVVPKEETPAVINSLTNFTYIFSLKDYIVVSLPLPKSLESDSSTLFEEQTLSIVHQRRAHTKILLSRIIQPSHENLSIQTLLAPITLNLTQSEIDFLQDKEQELSSIGFAFQQISSGSLAFLTLPQYLVKENLQDFIEAFLEQKKPQSSTQEKLLWNLITRTCIPSSTTLSKQESEAIIKQWLKTPNPYFTPSGKPIAQAFPYEILEKTFH